MPRLTAAQIADDLESQIHKSRYKPGEKLPSYRELALAYSVGITTISTAVALLRDRGVVYGEQGRGVFVADD